MTTEEFNSLGLSINDIVDIAMNDGTSKRVTIHTANAYLGKGEYENYTTKEIVPAESAKLLYINFNDLSRAYSINLEDIQSVELIN